MSDYLEVWVFGSKDSDILSLTSPQANDMCVKVECSIEVKETEKQFFQRRLIVVEKR